jgi:hypothetical protein
MLDIKGSFAVTKVRLAHPNISYVMLFTDDRVIFVKAARPSLRSIAGEIDLALLLGSAASADDLIRTDRDNFGLLYRHISRIRMKKSSIGHNGARSGVIDLDILGKKRATFDMLKGQDYEQCRSVVAAVMSDKLQ